MLSQTRTSPRNLSIVICLLLLAAAGEQVHAQNKRVRIAETLWGFDGRVVPGQFNPVSVLLDNLTDDAVEGVVTLQGVSGMLQDVGGRLAEPLYLSPHTMRWVQFYPYVSREATTWRLAIRTDKGVIFANELTQGRSVFSDALDGTDAKTASAVILDPSGLTNRIPTSVKHMPAEIFPPYSTALVGLQVLFLDHVPDWETPRQDALLSWVRSGGELHLLRDSNRQSLVFPSAMADLNQPFDDFLLGSGRVVRHDIQRSELSQAIVYPITLQMGFSEDPDRVEIKQQNEIKVRSSVSAPSVIDEELFAGMRLLTQPEHAWWLIFLMSLCYIGLIFPGCWFLSQNKKYHYLVTYGTIAGLSVLFSIIFLLIGRRGYGESTVSHSVAVARMEDPGHWNMLQWTTLFVTDGDEYIFSARDQQALFSAGDSQEQVAATIVPGNKATFAGQIPPFSSQTIISRRRISLPDWKLSLVAMNGDGRELIDVLISTGQGFPSGKDTDLLLLYGKRLYRGAYDATNKTIVKGASIQTLDDFCATRRTFEYQSFWMPMVEQADDPRTKSERFMDESIYGLMARSLVDDGVVVPEAYTLPPDRVRLYVYTNTLDGAMPDLNAETKTEGRILFVCDLPLEKE